MKEKFRLGLLKYLAFLSVNIFIYSLAVVIRTILFKDDGHVTALVLYVFIQAAGLILMRFLQDENLRIFGRISESSAFKFLAFTFNIKERLRFITSAAIYLSLFLPVLAALSVYAPKGIFRCLFEILLLLIPWYVSARNRNNSFSLIMSHRTGMGGFAALIAAIELAVMNEGAAHLKPYLFAVSYAYILLYLILRNQEDIDENIFDRKHIEKSILPRNLRSFNIKAVIAMFLGIILLFNLKQLALWLIQIAGKLILYFIEFSAWLSSLFLPSGNFEPPAPRDSGPGFAGTVGTVVNPWSNFVFNVLKYFVLIYGAYLLLPFLAKRLSGVASRILSFLGKLVSRGGEDRTLQSADYDDVTEFIKPETGRTRKQAVKTVLRRARRNLAGIMDPVERVRFIYASILGMLTAYGIKTEKSDTTLDILRKAEVIDGIGMPLNDVTDIYNSVRYGGLIPGPETLSKTEEKYARAAELIRHVRQALP